MPLIAVGCIFTGKLYLEIVIAIIIAAIGRILFAGLTRQKDKVAVTYPNLLAESNFAKELYPLCLQAAAAASSLVTREPFN